MGTAKPPQPVKLIASLFAGRPSLLEAARARLEEAFGPADHQSEQLPFDHTDYYTPEFGPDLARVILAFERLIAPDALAAAKLSTNAMEAELAESLAADVARPVNLDPGYVTPAKLVLASCKDYSHRIYLAEGVYAEITLTFERGAWRAHPWTYPDYRTPGHQAFLSRVREQLRTQLRRGG